MEGRSISIFKICFTLLHILRLQWFGFHTNELVCIAECLFIYPFIARIVWILCVYIYFCWLDGFSRTVKVEWVKPCTQNNLGEYLFTATDNMKGLCLDNVCSVWSRHLTRWMLFFSLFFYLMAIRIFMMFGREMAFMFAWANIYYIVKCEMDVCTFIVCRL